MLTSHRAAWLLGRLEGAFAPAGREGVGGYLMSGGGGLAQLAAALCPRRTDARVLLLQAAVRRVLQRGMRVCEVCRRPRAAVHVALYAAVCVSSG